MFNLNWILKAENVHFFVHLAAVAVLAWLAELFYPGMTMLAFPGVVILAAASFMWNYPIESIKNHGLFAEWKVEMRLMWLLFISLFVELAVYGVLEKGMSALTAALGLALVALVFLVARSHFQKRIESVRGFK